MINSKRFFKSLDHCNQIEIMYNNGCFTRTRYCNGQKMYISENITSYEAAINLGVSVNELLKKQEKLMFKHKKLNIYSFIAEKQF